MAYEYEEELELEDELEDEGEEESEEFLGDILGESEDFLGGLLGESEDFLGGLLGESEDFLGDILGESEGEDEYEDEAEDEFEEEVSPIRKIYPDAVMEHLGELAAESESEDEAAEHFLPLVGMAATKLLPVVAKAVAPMAKKALPKIARALTRSTPHLTKGVGRVARILHRNPHTRHLLRTVPGIARRTVGHIAHRVARGARVTPRLAVKTLARQARRVLGTPAHRAQALRRHGRLERSLHRRMGGRHWHPRWGWRYGRGYYGRGGRPRYGYGYRGVRGVPGVRRAGLVSGPRVRGVASRARGIATRYGRPKGGCPACGHCCCCGRG